MSFYNKELKDGFQIKKTPIKYQTKKEYLRYIFNEMTPLEKVVYMAYQVNTLKEIAKILKKSHIYIRNIYLRANEKAKNALKNADFS